MSDCKVVLEICLTALVNESRTQIVLFFLPQAQVSTVLLRLVICIAHFEPFGNLLYALLTWFLGATTKQIKAMCFSRGKVFFSMVSAVVTFSWHHVR